MQSSKALLASCLILSGCTSTLGPVQAPLLAEQQPGPCGVYPGETDPKLKLAWYSCRLRERAQANLAQSRRWMNRTEWRDIPLMGAAATIVGLVLFGNRNDANVLTSGTQEAIEITAFGAATFTALTNYLSPQKARKLLRQAARGHQCMADQADIITAIWDDVKGRSGTRRELESNLEDLTRDIAALPAGSAGLQQYVAIRDAGVRALTLYDRQVQHLNASPIYLTEAAWNFGIELLEAADRDQVNVTQLIQTISEQASSIARFGEGAQPPGAPGGPPAGQPGVRPGQPRNEPGIERDAGNVSAKTATLLAALPNVQALTLGFERCSSVALVDGNPTATRIEDTRPE